MKFQCAMGTRSGDTLEIRNQWAAVVVSRELEAPNFIVTGDLADTCATSKEFNTLADAMAYAFDSLALYQQGRAD